MDSKMDLSNLTPDQLRAVTSRHADTLVIAGPGSGKTHTIATRIVWLVQHGVEPGQIALLTFTNAAAKELQERVIKHGVTDRLGFVGTLHGFCLQQLQRYGRPLGYTGRITVLDAEQSDEALQQSAKTVGCKSKLSALRRVAESMPTNRPPRTPDEITIAHYRKALRAAGAIDYDTILADYLELITNCEFSEVQWFEHLLVDEYQDSSDMDKRIYNDFPCHNWFFVGDPDQAIYSFRGGNVDNIITTAQSSTWNIVKLQGNFRCAHQICEAANNLIRHNIFRVKKETSTMRNATGKVSLHPTLGIAEEEALSVARTIAVNINDGYEPMEIAVLARTNAIVRDFAAAAEAIGVPVRKKKPPTNPEDWVKARCAVELLNNPDNAIVGWRWLKFTTPIDEAEGIRRQCALEGKSLTRYIPELALVTDKFCDLETNLTRLGVSLESIEALRPIAASLPEKTHAALSLAMLRADDHEEEMGKGVTFTTIHGAKGREWGMVYLVAFEQGILPGKADLEEDRRLAFVGITRAKDHLHITAAESRRQTWGSKKYAPAEPSQFFGELASA